jgi:hypothetical protein
VSRALFGPLRIVATAQIHIHLDFTIDFYPRRIAMKQATFCVLLFVIAAALAVLPARAQGTLDPNLNDPDKEKAADRDLNRGLNAGKVCLDYQVDVISLFDNDHRIYWRDKDCIRVHVTNNPFLYKYTVSIDEELIHEDDPLGSLGKLIGVNVSSATGTGTNTDSTKNDASEAAKPSPGQSPLVSPENKAQAVAEANRFLYQVQIDSQKLPEDLKAPNPRPISPQVDAFQQSLSKIIDEGKQGNYEAMREEKDTLVKNNTLNEAPKKAPKLAPVVNDVKNLNIPAPAAPAPPDLVKWANTAQSLKTQAAAIRKTYDLVSNEYRAFSGGLPLELKALVDYQAHRDSVEKLAEDLEDRATKEFNCLSDAISEDASDVASMTLDNCPGGTTPKTGSKTLESRLLDFAHDAAALHAAIQPYLDPAKGTPDATVTSDDLHAAGGVVAFVACAYKGIRDNDLSSLQTHLIDPLNSVITDGFSWGYEFPDAAYNRVGPYSNPTGVTMTLKKTRIYPFAASPDGSTPQNTTSSFQCSSDTSDMFEHGANYQQLNDFFTDKPVQGGKPNTYTRNQNKPTPPVTPSDQSANKAKSTGPVEEKALVQPWFFGRARLVVSGGITPGFLADKQYQRATNSSGTAVVGLKTDQKERLTPMLYGHVLLGYGRHDPDAWYGTLGVTAKSDNQGTDPEFLVGFSRSVAQQRFFFTLGAYIGEKQKLDGGLQLGQTIPSSLTGELPITKGYHVGVGFGISYRFASTKDPQKDTSTQNTSGKSTSSQKKTSK